MRHIHIYVFLFIACLSCASDVDFDQADDITLTPRVDADLIFFTLETADFVDESLPDVTAIVRDTTRLEFLDDGFVRDNVKQIEFTFQFDNTFGQSLTNRTVFLNEANEEQYVIEFDVNPSADGSVQRTTFVEVVNEEDLGAIQNSIQLANELTLNTNAAPISGVVSLQSKAIYSLEFSDL